MSVLNFIINNILTQTSVVIGLIALVGLCLQKKGVGETISGTMKTMLGFMVLSAGSAVIVSALGSVKKFVSLEENVSFWVRILI